MSRLSDALIPDFDSMTEGQLADYLAWESENEPDFDDNFDCE